MPELPDVERFRCSLRDHLVGRRIDRVEVLDPSVLRNTSAADFRRMLRARRFSRVDRHGKWLIARRPGPTMLMHFGMTGSIEWFAAATDRHRADRVIFEVDDGELRYCDQRKLGGIWIARDASAIERITGPLGPDALGLSLSDLRRILSGRRRALKTALTDQSIVAGLGNMMSDEILWRARVHPTRGTQTLSPREVARMHRALRTSLEAAVKAGRIPRARSWLRSTRDVEDATCPRCHTRLQWSRIGGRGSIWCPQCQDPSPERAEVGA